MTAAFWLKAVSVMIVAILVDIVWARYISNAADQRPFAAANFSVLILLLGTYNMVAWLDDKRFIVPLALGSWLGTFVAVKIGKKAAP